MVEKKQKKIITLVDHDIDCFRPVDQPHLIMVQSIPHRLDKLIEKAVIKEDKENSRNLDNDKIIVYSTHCKIDKIEIFLHSEILTKEEYRRREKIRSG